MNMAFDLYGVIEKYPTELNMLCRLLNTFGANIHVISAPPIEEIRGWLQTHNAHHFIYKIHSVVDFLKNDLDVSVWIDDNGQWWSDETSQWSSKARICELNDIDILIDNEIEYQQYFYDGHRTKFVLLSGNEETWLRDVFIGGLIGNVTDS